jgi:hypothetical protein
MGPVRSVPLIVRCISPEDFLFRRLWLLLPDLGLYAADVALTLAGQPAAYWGGDYSQAVEHNPLAYPILAWHPFGFIGAGLSWAVVFSAVIVLWRNRVSDWIAVLLAFGHAVGGSTWLARHGFLGLIAAIAYLAVTSRISGACWQHAGLESETRAEPDAPPEGGAPRGLDRGQVHIRRNSL